MKASDTHIRGARQALALHRKIGACLLGKLEHERFQQCGFNGDGSNFPTSLHTVSDMLLVSNLCGWVKEGGAFWIEVAVSLDESAIPVVTVSYSLNEDAQLFIAAYDEKEIFLEIEHIFAEFIGHKPIVFGFNPLLPRCEIDESTLR